MLAPKLSFALALYAALRPMVGELDAFQLACRDAHLNTVAERSAFLDALETL